MTNRAIVESFYEAVGEKAVGGDDGVKRGDIDHLRQIPAENIEWTHPEAQARKPDTLGTMHARSA